MGTSGRGLIFLVKFLRRLRGGSQPILAQASDGITYVVKFKSNPQGPNLLFNECAGSELYRAFGLPIPQWQSVYMPEAFIERHPESWIETEEGIRPPAPGLCYASEYVGGTAPLYEILPSARFGDVRNLRDFWLAWLVDICAEHADNRQAAFVRRADGSLRAYFFDHGHLFGGPSGDRQSHFVTSRYLDARIYPSVTPMFLLSLKRAADNLDATRLLQRVEAIPDEWRTAPGFQKVVECLNRLSRESLVANILDTMMDSLGRTSAHDKSECTRWANPVNPVLLSAVRARRRERTALA